MIYVCGYTRHEYHVYCRDRFLNPRTDATFVADVTHLQGRSIGPDDEVVWGPHGDFELWKEMKSRQARG